LIPSRSAGQLCVLRGSPIVRGPSQRCLALLILGRPLIYRVRAHCETGA
jgi:hypothetical protein